MAQTTVVLPELLEGADIKMPFILSFIRKSSSFLGMCLYVLILSNKCKTPQ
jgi:hypothetical protein